MLMINFTGDFYNLYTYNCSSFASEATEVATGELINPRDRVYFMYHMDTPREFAEEILELEEHSPTTATSPYVLP